MCGLPAPVFTTNTKVQQYYMHMAEEQNSPKSDSKCENYGYNILFTHQQMYCLSIL